MKCTLTFSVTLTLSLLLGLMCWTAQSWQPAQAAVQATYPLNPASFTSLGASPFTSAGTYTINASKNNATPVLTKPDNTTINGVFFNSSGGEIAVFTFDTIYIPANVTVEGVRNANSRPVALLSKTSVLIAGTVAVSGESGDEGSSAAAGAGGAAGSGGGGGGGGGGLYRLAVGGQGGVGFVNGSNGENVSIGNGGNGGPVAANGEGKGGIYSSGGGGAFGGAGGGIAAEAGLAGQAYGDLTMQLQGGSGGGGAKGYDLGAGGGGGGGGAVEIGALSSILILGSVQADGGNGANGGTNDGGGGAGGGILIHGASLTLSCASRLNARGGEGDRGLGYGGGGGRVHLAANTIKSASPLNGIVNVAGGRAFSGVGVLTTSVTPEIGPLARQLVFLTHPNDTQPNLVLNPAVAVQELDTCGDPASNATSLVTLALNQANGATLSGNSVNAVGGIASFSNLKVSQPGTSYTLTASGSGLNDATSNSFNITCPTFTVGTPANTGALGNLYSSFAAASPAAPSGFKYQYSLANGTVLPSGLTLNPDTGVISGTPTASGTVSFDLKAELVTTGNVATGCSDTKTRSLNISCPAFTVGTPTNTGALGVVYSGSAVASPAAPSGYKYQYLLANSTVLPGGLSLDANTGVISGTPTASGNVSFDLKAELLTSGDGATGCSNTQTRSINVTCVSNPVVTNLNDSGAGSLRAAIATACAGTTITFAANVTGAITLTSGDLAINKDLTIQGPGANLLTINGNNAFRVFYIDDGPSIVTIAGLNLINGNGNGAVNSGEGGAVLVRNRGTTTLREISISGSSTLFGGAIEFENGIGSTTTLNLIRSTLSGNTATASNSAGGIDIRTSGTLNIVNSTIAGNQAPAGQGGGIGNHVNDQIAINLVNSTITNNQGGGLLLFGNQPSANVRNTLLTLNTGGDLQQVSNGSFVSNGYNIFGTGVPGGAVQATDQVGVNPLFELDGNNKPLLANNGGPTQTIKLLPGSPALDKGSAATDPSTNQPLTTDQRGQARPYDFPGITNANGGNGSDIGAYEYQCGTLTLGALPNGVAGVAYSQALNPGGGLAPYASTHTGGTLPPGLTLNNGSLSGTPTTSGSFSFTLNVTDAYGCTGSRSYTVTVGCPSLALAPATLANGVQGAVYNQTLTTSPAGTVYSYAVTTGSLPPGLTLASNGALTGTPTAGGNYAFAVTVTGWGGCTKTQSYSLLITGTCSTITLNPTSLPGGALGALYSQALSATGGAAPYTYSVTTGALPAGLTLNASTGELSGTPTASGLSSFTIRATGQGGCAGSRSYVLSVGCGALTFAPATLPNGVKGAAYQQQLSVSPATSATFSLQLGSLPPGFALSSSGLLSGTTTQAGTFNFTVKALAGSCQGTKAYTLVIGTGTAALALSGDYDGDGKSDPALWSAKDGVWRIVRSVDGQSVSQRWGTAGDVSLLGDYDGDGKSDLAVFRPADATFYVKRSSDGGTLIKAWGLSSDSPVPGDYDGDGKTDIAVWRGSEGNWYVLRSSDGQTEVQAWGASYAPYLDVPVAGDYDGDGKTDLAVFRKGNGTWFIKRSRDGQMQSKLWGLGTDVPVAQDYDGDGQTDLAVWRGSTWYIWQSASNTGRTAEWGSSAAPYHDQAAPGDYDGDGQADLAVWRGAESTWYVRESRTQSGRTQSLGQSGDRPIGQPTR